MRRFNVPYFDNGINVARAVRFLHSKGVYVYMMMDFEIAVNSGYVVVA